MIGHQTYAIWPLYPLQFNIKIYLCRGAITWNYIPKKKRYLPSPWPVESWPEDEPDEWWPEDAPEALLAYFKKFGLLLCGSINFADSAIFFPIMWWQNGLFSNCSKDLMLLNKCNIPTFVTASPDAETTCILHSNEIKNSFRLNK